MRRFGPSAVFIVRALFFFCISLGFPVPAHRSAPQQKSQQTPDEVLWNAIQQLENPAETSKNTPFDLRIPAQIRHKELLIEKIHSYQLLYPGGEHFQTSIERELETLFELCTLIGDFARLESRLGQIDSTATDENSRAIAAWWRIHLIERAKSGEIPAMTGLFERDRRLLQAMAAFARRYPKSPLAIRATTLAVEDCIRRKDFDAATEWIRQLNEAAPDSPATIRTAGMLRRADSIGKQLTGSFALLDGGSLDIASLRGSRVCVACWNSAEERARQFAAELQGKFQNVSDVRIVGVDLNPTVDETRRWATSLGLSWIQTNDRRGAGGGFVRHWGIDDAPTLIWLDRAGLIEAIAGPGEIASALCSDRSAGAVESQPASP